MGTLRGKRIGVLGLAFKPNTDDVRESPAINFIERILEEGAIVCAHDPVARHTAAAVLGERVRYVDSPYEAIHDADAAVVATEWNEYKQLDFAMMRKLMAGNTICDARNLYEPAKVTGFGFTYIGVGRGLKPRPATTVRELIEARAKSSA